MYNMAGRNDLPQFDGTVVSRYYKQRHAVLKKWSQLYHSLLPGHAYTITSSENLAPMLDDEYGSFYIGEIRAIFSHYYPNNQIYDTDFTDTTVPLGLLPVPVFTVKLDEDDDDEDENEETLKLLMYVDGFNIRIYDGRTTTKSSQMYDSSIVDQLFALNNQVIDNASIFFNYLINNQLKEYTIRSNTWHPRSINSKFNDTGKFSHFQDANQRIITPTDTIASIYDNATLESLPIPVFVFGTIATPVPIPIFNKEAGVIRIYSANAQTTISALTVTRKKLPLDVYNHVRSYMHSTGGRSRRRK